MSDERSFLESLSALAVEKARLAEKMEVELGKSWPASGHNAIEDMYFLAGHTQDLVEQAKAFESIGLVRTDEELILDLCLTLAEHVRLHPYTAKTGGDSGSLIN